jgi:PAS domain S-box-containing protein
MDKERADVSSRVQESHAEEPPETIRAELEAILDHAGTAVAVYEAVDGGSDFIIVDFNRAAEDIEQVKKQDVVGKSVLEVFPGVREFGLFEAFQRVWQTGEPMEHPISIYKDWRITGWRRNYVCKLPNGQIIAVYEDVGRARQSELATRMSEQCFRAIADYTYDWEIWVGPAGRVLWMNPAATRISGYSVKEIVAMGDYPGPLVYEADRERVLRAFRSAVGGSTGNEQFRLKHKEGRILWAEISWQPIYDEKGNSLGHRESIRDVTAHKLAEQAVQLAEREKEAILDNMTEHIIHLDADSSILWANRAVCDAAGLTREQVIGRFYYELPVEWHELWDTCPAAKAMETGKRIEVERSAPGGRTWFIQAAPVRDRKGGIIGGVEIALDITNYKRGERPMHERHREDHEIEAEVAADDPAEHEA